MPPSRSVELRCIVAVVVVVVIMAMTADAKTREYFVGVVEEEWDYAPGGGDLTAFRTVPKDSGAMNQGSDSSTYLEQGPDRIGRKYLKAMYREFTDRSFTRRKSRAPWMGLLGPVLGGDQGDVVTVHFKNMAPLSGRNFSMHPHGLQYTKDNEGALYMDDTEDALKEDESVGPGQEFTYRWEVTAEVTPTADDPACLTWTYHSHVDTVRDVNSGLVGVLITCKPGTMDTLQDRFANQFAMVANVFDENQSWYIDRNIRSHIKSPSPLTEDYIGNLKEDEDFVESNMMHGYNGLVYGHLQGLDVCVGGRTVWFLIGFGTEMDIHSLSVSGHSFLVHDHRVDAVGLNPVDFVTAELEPLVVGEWRVQCTVLNHVHAGEVALLNVTDCGHMNSSVSTMNIQGWKRYFIAIDEVDWNYAPSGLNRFEGGDLLAPNSYSEKYFGRGSSRVGGVYRKALYRQYEDMTFSTKTKRGPEEEHLGFLGPVLRVETGDVLVVTLKNQAAGKPFSIHPHGATFSKLWEGALYNDSTSGANHEDDFVEAGQVKTFYWLFPEAMGPGPMDPPCITRLYTSSSRDLLRDAYSGLVGPILICRRGALDAHGRQRQVDREFFLMFSVTDENLSWYSGHNFGSLQGDTTTEEFQESNMMHGINGYMYGNLPGLDLCEGDRASWHLLGVGSEQDVHAAYFHGQALTWLDTRRSGASLLPGYFRTLLMKADNPGDWAVVDQTSEHYQAGAKALFHVRQCGLRRDYGVRPASGGQKRVYYLQAQEEMWDYAPSGQNLVAGGNLTDPEKESYIFTTTDGPYIGTKYLKVRYHQYTDGTFSTEVRRPDSERYLGVLGPVIMAEAYDSITVVFRNKATRPYSVHAQGLFYTKQSEGSPYANGMGAVQPGETVTYQWSVPADFAPAEGDHDCINQAYYSSVDPVKDVNSGLIGPLLICKPGVLDNASGSSKGVDRTLVLLFKVFDEGQSWYLQTNVRQFGTNDSLQDPDFGESNLMHSINGYVYGNNPLIEVTQNDTVAWHLMSLGNQVDIHSTHWHGNPVLYYRSGRHAADVVQLFPGVFETVLMSARRVGKWLLHCHVHDHLSAGMETVYRVNSPPPAAPAPADDPFGEDVAVH